MTPQISIGKSPDGHPAELHETPHEALFALIDADPWLQQRRRIWEPACGPGQLVEALQLAGHDVIASDLYAYDGRWKGDPGTERHWHFDFLDSGTHRLKRGVEAIVTNPPFSLSDAFIMTGLALVPRVYVLLPLGWVQAGSGAPMRDELVDGDRFIRWHPLRERLHKMHRDGWDGPRNKSGHKHAWYVFGRPQSREEIQARRLGIPVMRRITTRGDVQ